MWFKNIRILEFQSSFKINAEQLEQQLTAIAFKPCAKSLPISYGWVSPLDTQESMLTFKQNAFILLKLRIEEKILPPVVIREHLHEEIKELQQKFGRKIHKDEKERLKDEIYQTLLPKAFTKSSYVYGYIDLEKNWLIVDAASSKKLSYFVSLLHKCIEQQAYLPELKPVSQIMTKWLMNNDYPNSLSFTDAGVLKKNDENTRIARFKNQDLLSDKVQSFLHDGSQAIQLGFVWADQIQFTLKEDLSISSLRFLEAVKEQQDGVAESPEERFSADFLIMSKTLQTFLTELLTHFKVSNSTKKAEALTL